MSAPPPPSVARAAAHYTLLRLAVFLGCFVIALAVVLPLSASEPVARRLALAALPAAVLSVPLSLLLGRGLRTQLAGALDAARRRRASSTEDYAARSRAARHDPPAP